MSAPTQTTSKGAAGTAGRPTAGGVGRPLSEVVRKEKHRSLKMMLQQRNAQASTVVIGIILIVFMLGIGATLIILAGIFSITGLYIVGAIFALGGAVFTVVFIVTNCTPYCKNRKIHAQLDDELAKVEQPTALEPGHYSWTVDDNSDYKLNSYR